VGAVTRIRPAGSHDRKLDNWNWYRSGDGRNTDGDEYSHDRGVRLLMKWLILFLSLSWISPVWAAIAHGGACDGTTGCTPSSQRISSLTCRFPLIPVRPCRAWPQAGQALTTKSRDQQRNASAMPRDYSATAAASGTFSSSANVGFPVHGYGRKGRAGLRHERSGDRGHCLNQRQAVQRPAVPR